jgi:hypothetical protein
MLSIGRFCLLGDNQPFPTLALMISRMQLFFNDLLV